MPIATRCTCSMSLTGFCASDIRECKQSFLTEMDNCYQMSQKKYTRDQIKDAIWQELKESDYAGENNDRAYEIIGIVMAGVDKIVGGDVQPSAVWVKASERLPGVRTEVKWRLDGVEWEAKETVLGMWYNKPNDFHKHEWLDESGTAAGREEDAVAFAEWIRANHYNPYGNRWRRTGSNLERSSAQLYELFKQKDKR